MKPSSLSYAIIAAIVLIYAAAASATSIDMDDPRRALGREDGVRIDAQLNQDTVSPGSALGVTYQIENLSDAPVAVADRVTTASYDSDSGTITLAIGSEVPQDGRMPHVVKIAPGEKKIFRTGATPMLNTAAVRASLGGAPRFVQVKVTILRDLEPFASLITKQVGARPGEVLSDELFDRWFEANDTILLNAVPVRYSARRNGATPEGFVAADRRDAGSSF